MSDVKVPDVTALLDSLLKAWVSRNGRKAAKDAGALTFWRDGMLEKLQAIADKKVTARTFVGLKREYERSAEGVSKARTKLLRAREKLAGSAVARQIDAILHSTNGKMTIRREIQRLIRTWDYAKTLQPDDPRLPSIQQNLAQDARDICGSIEVFNAAVQRLHRMVYDD